MNTLFTIGFTQKSAQQFFGLLKDHGVTLLADIRLNVTSQLAGFAKARDLQYFLKLHGIRYAHWLDLAPTKELREIHGKGHYRRYERAYRALIARRQAVHKLPAVIFGQETVCLLCAEAKPDTCHRRVVAAMIQATIPGLKITHL